MSPPNQDPGPGATGFSITPNDNTDLGHRTRGLYVGVEGDVSVDLAEGGKALVFVALAAGVIHPIAAIRVNSTGTTATNLVGLY